MVSAIRARSSIQKIKIIEEAFKKNIPDQRFIPYIQLHEFEGLLFSNVDVIDEVLKPYHDSRLQDLRSIKDQFNTPEEINDGIETSPSKRIISLFKSYQKVTHGYQIAQRIGIDAIRRECPHFNEWIVKLGQLGIYGQIRS